MAEELVHLEIFGITEKLTLIKLYEISTRYEGCVRTVRGSTDAVLI
jgi:hypothetical protein